MSKGLVALKHLYAKLSAKSSIDDISENLKEYDVIEKELKEYETINTKYKLAIEFIDNIADQFDEHDLEELEDKIIKTRKTLEIIKTKKVNVHYFMSFVANRPIPIEKQLEYWNDGLPDNEKLTEEEYDLLKEVLL